MVRRKSLVVYFKNDNFIKSIDDSVNIQYVSKKRKYAVLFMDENRIKGTRNFLQRTKGVLGIEDGQICLETF